MSSIISNIVSCFESQSTIEDDEPICRICFLPCDEPSPCQCKGSVGWIHLDCLVAWILFRTRGRRNICDLCHMPFSKKELVRRATVRYERENMIRCILYGVMGLVASFCAIMLFIQYIHTPGSCSKENLLECVSLGALTLYVGPTLNFFYQAFLHHTTLTECRSPAV